MHGRKSRARRPVALVARRRSRCPRPTIWIGRHQVRKHEHGRRGAFVHVLLVAALAKCTHLIAKQTPVTVEGHVHGEPTGRNLAVRATDHGARKE
eukprot:5079560-Prymnesium_polylepis.2